MKTLVLSGNDCDTYMLVALAIKLGMNTAKVMRENNLVSEAEAEYQEEEEIIDQIDRETNEETWRLVAINYFNEDLKIEVVDLQEWNGDETNDLVPRINAALMRLNEAKQLLGKPL